MPPLNQDPVPRLLLTVLVDERCEGTWINRCGFPLVRAYPTPGLLEKVPYGSPIEGTFCLNKSCPKALGALGPLNALKAALAAFAAE